MKKKFISISLLSLVMLMFSPNKTLATITDLMCSGNAFSVSYQTGNTIFNTGNVFTVQLSNANGSFANPFNIGSLQSINSGTIIAVIPNNMALGNGYKVRVISSNPANVVVLETNYTFSIWGAANLPSCLSISAGTTSTLSVPLTVQTGYQWKKDGFDIAGATSNTLTVSSSGNYTLEMTGLCGGVVPISQTKSVQVYITGPFPNPVINPTSLAICDGEEDILSVSSCVGCVYQWRKNGVNISGANSNNLIVSSSGNYSVVVNNNPLCSSSAKISNTVTVKILQPTVIPGKPCYDPLVSGQPSEISLQPNPANNEFEMETHLSDNTFVQLDIVNALGEVLYKSSELHNKGTYRKTIDVSLFIPGIYFVSLKTAENTSTKKLVISK